MNETVAQLTPLDFASTWQTYALHNLRERRMDAGEIAFWRQNAAGYDQHIHDDTHSRQTLVTIQSHLRPDDTLLDVGAGSGHFALPLAQQVRFVTALDLSPDMLSLLEGKKRAQKLTNIETVCGNWEDVEMEPHDVVLAAWSLYRQRDILSSLQKLIAATRRMLIIVDGDYAPRPDDDPPHERLRASIWGEGDPGLCNYLYFAGMLRQCRVRADVKIVHETLTHTTTDVTALARHFAPAGARATDHHPIRRKRRCKRKH